MSVTLTNLLSYARDWLSVNSTRLPDAALTQAINFAQKDILRQHDLWFAETRSSQSIVAGTQSYALPSTPIIFSRPIAVDFTDPNDTTKLVPVDEVSWEEFLRDYGSSVPTTGEPAKYAIFGSSIYYGPTPDRTFTMSLSWYGVFIDLASGGDHNNLTDNAYELVLFKAMAYACKYMIEDARAPMYEALANEQLRIVNAEHKRRLYSAKRAPAMREPG